MDGLQVRFAEPRDSSQIVNLFSSGFRPGVAQLLIYGCKGAAEYIRMQLACSTQTSESAYFVGQLDGEIIGAVELRRRPNWLFLNYIGVLPKYRGRHVGTMLFSEAVRMSGVCSGEIGLDVFDDNIPALDWYRGIGFEVKTSTELVEIVPAYSGDEPLFYVSGLPQADLCQGRFGFSKFNLITKEGTFAVGRIADVWFRLTDVTAVGSSSVLAALRTMEPGRRIFAAVPPHSVPPARVVRVLAKSHRMEVEIPSLMLALANDYKKS